MPIKVWVQDDDSHVCAVGSFTYGNAFFATVCTRLEGGVWGSRFPVIMNHLSWYRIEVEWLSQALLELEVIKRELSALPVSDVVWVVGLPEVQPPYDVGGNSGAVNLAEFFTTVDGKNLIDELMGLLTYAQQIDSHVLKNYVYDPYIDWAIIEFAVVIQDHAAGHQFGAEGGKGDQPAHIHARPASNTWTGSIDGAQRNYYFESGE